MSTPESGTTTAREEQKDVEKTDTHGLTRMAGWAGLAAIAAITAQSVGPLAIPIGAESTFGGRVFPISRLDLGVTAGIAVYAVVARGWPNALRSQRIGEDALIAGMAVIVLSMLQLGMGWDHPLGIYAPAVATIGAGRYREKEGPPRTYG
jgi:hypothetical protein